MTDSLDEKISALVDGELDDFGQQAAISALSRDESQRQRWERYHVISDTLQRNMAPAMDPQFSTRVMQALESEPAILVPKPKKSQETPSGQSSWTRRVAGLAVAASVAMIGVFGVQTMNQQNPAMAPTMSGQPIAKLSIPQGKPQLAQQVAESTSPLSQADAAHQRYLGQHLNKYLVDHSQRAAQARVQGVMPYARIITFPTNAHQEQRGR
jgi:sigma-E factor negative regulatory protein RseA